jgi:ABC-2 type transport system ATP-binding protein
VENKQIITVKELNYSVKKRSYKGCRSYFRPNFNEVSILKDINLQVLAGHIIGLVGPEGAGKTTLVEIIAGYIKPSQGTIEIESQLGTQTIQPHPAIKLISKTHSNLWPELSAREVLPLVREKYRIPQIELTDATNEIVELLGITDVIKTQSRKLSLANKLKCELLIALLANPEIIIIDGIFDEIDTASHRKLYELLSLIQNHWQLAIIITTHHIETINNLCQQIVLMDSGKVIYQGDLPELIQTYANYQYMDIMFERTIDTDMLANLGKVIEGEGLYVRLRIARDNKGPITSELLQKFPVKDIQVNEPPITEIAENVTRPVSENVSELISLQPEQPIDATPAESQVAETIE